MARTYAIDEADDMRARFVYKPDGRIDTIRILGDEDLRGDCDDAAATMLWRAESRSLWYFWMALILGRAAIWRCVTGTGERHAILWHRDHGWIENGTFEWTEDPAPDLMLRHRRWVVTIAFKMLLGKLF